MNFIECIQFLLIGFRLDFHSTFLFGHQFSPPLRGRPIDSRGSATDALRVDYYRNPRSGKFEN